MLALGPDHLSAYNLTFEEDTRFKRWLDRGRLERSPEEVELAMFETTRRLTAEHGLDAYEISNHARPGEECAHNIGYWRNGAYVGIGPGAVSKVGHSRAGNPRGIAPYLRRVADQGHATHWREDLDPAARLAETWWLGLRLAAGVDPEEARRTAGAERSPPQLLPSSPRSCGATTCSSASLGRLQAHAARHPPRRRGGEAILERLG